MPSSWVYRNGRLSLAITLAIALILAAGLALVSYLNYANFKRDHAELVQSRILVLVQDLRNLIEASMNLGLGLTQVSVLPQRLQQMVDEDEDILAVVVFGPQDGKALLHAAHENVAIPERIPQSWRQPAGEHGHWHLIEPNRYLLGLPLYNSFNVQAGTLMLIYDRVRADAPVAAMGAHLMRHLAMVVAILTVAAAFGIHRLNRPLRDDLDAATARVRNVADEGGAHPAHTSDLISHVDGFMASCAQALRRIEDAGHGCQADESNGPAAAVRPVTRLTGPNRFSTRILLLMLLWILLGIGATSYLGVLEFHRDFAPYLHRKAETLNASVARVLISLADHGVPMDRLRGLENYFEVIRKENPEVGYFALVDPKGEAISVSGSAPEPVLRYFRKQATDAAVQQSGTTTLERYFDTWTPLRGPTEFSGTLHIGQERRFIDQQVADIWWDLGTVALVTLLIAFEMVLFATAFLIQAPLSAIQRLVENVRAGDFSERIAIRYQNELGRLAAALNERLDQVNHAYQEVRAKVSADAAIHALASLERRYRFNDSGALRPIAEDRLIFIRWPFFLLIFSDALSLSFLPLYVKQLYVPVAWLSPKLAVSLPISVFMLVWALSLPAAGAWSDRVGRRRAFTIGALITATGLALTGTAQGLWDLLLWRSLTALGYGIVFITAQGYVVDYTPQAQRTRGMAMFLAAFFCGSLCGAAIGGIVAERIGYAPVFFLAALLALLAAGFAAGFLAAPVTPPAASARPALQFADIGQLLRNGRFLTVTVLAAIPAKLILTGFLYFAMPLYLTKLALSAGDVGRIMMSYGLAMILLSPLVGYLADVWGHRRGFTIVGGLLAALAILLVTLGETPLIALIAILLLGAAHAIGVSPQLTLVMDECREDIQRIGAGTVMGIFRLLERIGNVLGPVVVALLIGALDFHGAFKALGFYSLLSIALFGVALLAFARRDRYAVLSGSAA